MKAKRILSILLCLILAIGLMVSPAMAAGSGGTENEVVIKLHYNRPDGVYDDWSVWFWNYGFEGVDIPFAEENGEQVATFVVGGDKTSVGFIVKLPNWAAKDVNKDQFIDVAAYLSGTVHVYVEAGVEGYELVLDDDVKSGIKVRSAAYREGYGFQISMTAAIPNFSTAFTILGPDGPVETESPYITGNSAYTIKPVGELDLSATYTLI